MADIERTGAEPAKTPALSRDEFDADENLRLAVVHLIQIIGEAAGRISDEFCADHPEVRADITGMRHKVVHDYLGVDDDIVWRVVKDDLPVLIRDLEAIGARTSPPDSDAHLVARLHSTWPARRLFAKADHSLRDATAGCAPGSIGRQRAENSAKALFEL